MRCLLVFLFSLYVGPSSANFAIFMANGGQQHAQWYDLQIGGGGFVRGGSFAPDGTKLVRTDAYGGYLWNGSKWVQLLTSGSMPNGTYGPGATNATGLYELVVCPQNTNVAYMMPADGLIYKTTNLKSAPNHTWTATSFVAITVNPNDGNAKMGHFAAIDPADTTCSKLIWGGMTNKPQYSTDGGATWTTLSALTAPSSSSNNLIAFDGSSSTGGATPIFYISVYGTGVYRCTGGLASSSCSLTSGTPTVHSHLIVDQNGKVLLTTDQSQGLWTFSSGTWTQNSAGGTYHAVAVDPANASNIALVDDGGFIQYSNNGGTSFVNTSQNGSTTGDQTWLSGFSWTGGNSPGFTSGDIIFDASQSGVLFMTEGTGVAHSTPGTAGTTITWTTQVTGIEEVVSGFVMAPPSGGAVVGSEDFPVWYKPQSALGQNADALRPAYINPPFTSLMVGYFFDYIPGATSTIVGLVAGDIFESGGLDYSGFSTDHGNTWTLLGLATTTTSSNTVGTGTKTFTGFQTGLSLTAGQTVEIWPAINAVSNTIMFGTITSYNSGTGGLVASISSSSGSGTSSTWTLHTMPATAVSGQGGGNIVACSTSNLIWVPSGTSQTAYYSTDGGYTWTASNMTGLTFTNPDYFVTAQVVATDKVTANVAYLYVQNSNASPGVYKSTNCGQTWSIVHTGSLDATFDSGGTNFRTNPLVAGDIWFSSQFAFGNTPPTSQQLLRSTDSGVTWTAQTNWKEPVCFGFGPKVSGQSYPSIYVVGWLSNVFGEYISQDNGSTWTKFGDYPQGNFAVTGSCDGDKQIQGQLYLGTAGSGFHYYYPFLLRRDVDPTAANDNTPMWINKVA